MSARAILFRDPIHDQISFHPGTYGEFAGLLCELIDSRPFQRLRHIRQNGLAHLVFFGAEHSRFTHSLGVCHMASRMLDAISRNSQVPLDDLTRDATIAAALLHDLGHTPLSHALEDILAERHADSGGFHHERLTVRFLVDSDSEIRRILEKRHPDFPSLVASYIDPSYESPLADQVQPWSRKLVSSQLDADRLDYVLRDSRLAGTSRDPYDVSRLLEMLRVVKDGQSIGILEKGIDAVESYLVALLRIYRTVYFHKAERAAIYLLHGILARVNQLLRRDEEDGRQQRLIEENVVASLFGHDRHPLYRLITQGTKIKLDEYLRLTDFGLWTCIEQWQFDSDRVLADLSRRLIERKLLKTIKLDTNDVRGAIRLQEIGQKLTREALPYLDDDTVGLYVGLDEATRSNYQVYDWSPRSPDRSIFVKATRRGQATEIPLEDYQESTFITALRQTTFVRRLIFPVEIREKLLSQLSRM